jgi:spore coat protein A
MGDIVDPRRRGRSWRSASAIRSRTTALPASYDRRRSPLVQTGATRELLLFEGEDEYDRLQPILGTVAEGKKYWHDPITENPMLDDVEVWEVYNSTMDAHPIHLHLVAFQILDRQKFKAVQDPETGALTRIRKIGPRKPPPAHEAGWKDTAQMLPGEVTGYSPIASASMWHGDPPHGSRRCGGMRCSRRRC